MIRIRGALRSAIRLSQVSFREIERALGLSTGYLTRILAGQVELRVSVLLHICQVIGLPWGLLFTALYPGVPASPLSRGLAQLHPAARPRAGGNTSELIGRIRAVLDDFEGAAEV
jgi:transcriptional regulator with XRE-family HTH domain